MQYNRNIAVETRTHNAVNEIMNAVAYDANGNMTQMPSPKDGTNLNCVYDAWNRLVAIGEDIRYEYNGLNQRIAKTVDGVRTESFFNERWQELESASGGDSKTYVWGLRYIDDLVFEPTGEKLSRVDMQVMLYCNADEIMTPGPDCRNRIVCAAQNFAFCGKGLKNPFSTFRMGDISTVEICIYDTQTTASPPSAGGC